MRRIMIARRNNVKDHATLKKARAAEAEKRGVLPGPGIGKKKGKREAKSDGHLKNGEVQEGNHINEVLVPSLRPPSPSNPSGTKRRRVAGSLQPSDEEILMQMDIQAVEATRSYRKWLTLPIGTPFRYNQTYVKGAGDHDWLLKKNIWRRMRYRRENQAKVQQLFGEKGDAHWTSWKSDMPPHDADFNAEEADIGLKGDDNEGGLVSRAVLDAAAVAAAQVEPFEPGIDAEAVAALGADDPIVTSALDAAAQIAAVAVGDVPNVAGLEGNVVDGHLGDNALTVPLLASDLAASLGVGAVADPMAALGVDVIGNDDVGVFMRI